MDDLCHSNLPQKTIALGLINVWLTSHDMTSFIDPTKACFIRWTEYYPKSCKKSIAISIPLLILVSDLQRPVQKVQCKQLKTRKHVGNLVSCVERLAGILMWRVGLWLLGKEDQSITVECWNFTLRHSNNSHLLDQFMRTDVVNNTKLMN